MRHPSEVFGMASTSADIVLVVGKAAKWFNTEDDCVHHTDLDEYAAATADFVKKFNSADGRLRPWVVATQRVEMIEAFLRVPMEQASLSLVRVCDGADPVWYTRDEIETALAQGVELR